MSSGKLKIEFDNTAPATPEAGRSIIYPLGPEGDFFQKTPDGVVKQLSLPVGSKQNNSLSWDIQTSRWVAGANLRNYNYTTEVLEDWGGNATSGSFNWDSDVAASGNISSIQTFPIATDKRYGRIRYRITNASNSRAGHDRGAGELSLGGGIVRFSSCNWFPTGCFADQENTQFFTGLGSLGSDSSFPSTQVDGVYFRIQSGPSNARVFAVVEDGNIVTETEMTSVSLLSETWYRFDIEVNETATEVKFKVFSTSDTPPNINAVLLQEVTVTTGIPPASANIGPFNLFRHSAAGVLANIDLFQDYIYFQVFYNFER